MKLKYSTILYPVVTAEVSPVMNITPVINIPNVLPPKHPVLWLHRVLFHIITVMAYNQ